MVWLMLAGAAAAIWLGAIAVLVLIDGEVASERRTERHDGLTPEMKAQADDGHLIVPTNNLD